MDFSVSFGFMIGFSDNKPLPSVKEFDKLADSLYNNIRFTGEEQKHGQCESSRA